MKRKTISTDTKAVSEVIAVVVLVGMSVGIAAILNVSLSGTVAPIGEAPVFVNMKQSGDRIFIINVQNGPVDLSEVSIFIEDSSGIAVGSYTIHSEDSFLTNADSIEINGISTGEYTVILVCNNNIASKIPYIVD